MFWNWKVDADATVLQQKMWSCRDAVAGGIVTPNQTSILTRTTVRRTFRAESGRMFVVRGCPSDVDMCTPPYRELHF